jgi:hypothetical protein
MLLREDPGRELDPAFWRTGWIVAAGMFAVAFGLWVSSGFAVASEDLSLWILAGCLILLTLLVAVWVLFHSGPGRQLANVVARPRKPTH